MPQDLGDGWRPAANHALMSIGGDRALIDEPTGQPRRWESPIRATSAVVELVCRR
jgi:hypothetical protein